MGVLKARVGGAWVPITQGFSSAQVGYVTMARLTADQVMPNGGDTDVPGLSVTWTAIAGHTYRTRIVARLGKDGTAGSVYMIIANAAGTSITASGIAQVATANETIIAEAIETGLSGSTTRKARVYVNPGIVTVMQSATLQTFMIVEDITQVQPADTSLVTPFTDYTPQIDQGATTNIAKTLRIARYAMVGKIVSCQVYVTMSAAGTAGAAATVTLPVAAQGSATHMLGTAGIWDASSGIRYICEAVRLSGTQVAFGIDGTSSNVWGVSPNLALASGDDIRINLNYEAA